MKTDRAFLAWTLSLLVSASGTAVADDIDIFQNPDFSQLSPNVLIVIDNTANWSNNVNWCTALNDDGSCMTTESGAVHEFEMRALQEVINDVILQYGDPGFNVGLMLFVETGGDNDLTGEANDSIDGGYVRYGIRHMETGDPAPNRTALLNLLDNLDESFDKGNNATYALTMHEAFLYYAGMQARSGMKVKRDYFENLFPTTSNNANDNPKLAASNVVYALDGVHPFDDINDHTYAQPISDACQRNYIILLSNGPVDSGEDNVADDLLGGLTGTNPNPFELNPKGEQSNWTDEYAAFMSGADVTDAYPGVQSIITYTIDVAPKSVGQGPSHTALLKSTALRGNGQYFVANSLQDLKDALATTFAQIQATNSVFASVSLPISVNTQGTYQNQVYMGMFRPDANALPRWYGNLKQYQFALDNNFDPPVIFLADRNGDPVADGSTGFVTSTATSFWTTPSTFWSFKASSTFSASDSPDGNLVEKGAAAQRLRDLYTTSPSNRRLYTCTGCTTTLSNFSTTNAAITQAVLGAATATERDAIINWVLGQDNRETPGGENNNGSLTDVRTSIHGDVLHSRPVVIDYGGSVGVRVFYGANDGVFHALKGGQADTDGQEMWGFVPSEFFGQLRRLRENDPPIDYPAVPSGSSNKPYFVDGLVGSYVLDNDNDGELLASDGDKVYLYLTMRRGGRFIYALDVTTPSTPTLLWKHNYTDSGFGELAQTWSTPEVAKIGANTNPVLIFGAGYDPAEDESPAGTNTMGRGVFVVDAFTGNLVKLLTNVNMNHSIAAGVTVVDRNQDGTADRLYAADTGGTVWRMDIDYSDPNNWQIWKIAAVGGGRKFLHQPDVVFGSLFDSILIGSGDREHPLDTSVNDRFYMFKDPETDNSGTTLDITEATLYDATNDLTSTANAAALESADGWLIRLDAGEKVTGSAVTVGGITFFNTNRPTALEPGACTGNLGEARRYAVNFENATAATPSVFTTGDVLPTSKFEVMVGGGLPPSPIPGVVVIDGQKYVFVTDNPANPGGIMQPPIEPPIKRDQLYWFKENMD